MKKLKIAIIGAGQIARTTHLPIFKDMDDVEVFGISDVNRDAASQLAEDFQIPYSFDDHIEMIESIHPDAVIVCVPNRFHCRIVLDALEHGCHVLCEKPPAVNVSEAVIMEQTAREQQRLLTYGFHFRHSIQTKILKQKIDGGELGTIYHSCVQWKRKRGIPGWGNFTNKTMQGGGPLIDIGAHMLDTALYLIGYPEVDTVLATSSNRIGKRGGIGFMGAWEGEKFSVEDGLFGMIRFKNGTDMQIETTFALNQKEENVRNVLLYGDLAGSSLYPLEVYKEVNGQIITEEYPSIKEHDWHVNSDTNFVEACLGLEKLLVTAEQGTYIQRIIEALYKSADEMTLVQM